MENHGKQWFHMLCQLYHPTGAVDENTEKSITLAVPLIWRKSINHFD